MKELFNGIAVVIDDELDDESERIAQIVQQIEAENIPILSYKTLPDITEVKHFTNISFLLLDWNLMALKSDNILEGVRIPAREREEMEKKNIEYIQALCKICFCPIFIFSNENKNEITKQLVNSKLFFIDKPNRIFVEAKSELVGNGQLFEKIEKWLIDTPSMYVIKKWNFEYQKIINIFFNDFQFLSPYWPLVMWACFKDDEVNQSLELGELLTKNLNTRMLPFDFDKTIMEQAHPKIDIQELRSILEGERYISKDRLNSDEAGTGDLFKSKGKYLLNIRAQCDLLRKDDAILYCITGTKMTNVNEQKEFIKKYGQYPEKLDQSIIPFIDKGKIISFTFKEIALKKFSEIKNERIGRLLPPYITRIQQGFALYLQRQGLPRIPEDAINSSEIGMLGIDQYII
jgi:hypothetical protein